MKKQVYRGFALFAVLLLCGVMFVSGVSAFSDEFVIQSVTTGDVLYVGGLGPGNYSKIQDAIDNASEGDFVFIFNESSPYIENIVIRKSLTLRGEDKVHTIVNSKVKDLSTIRVIASDVRVENLGIIKTNYGGNYDGCIRLTGEYITLDNNLISANDAEIGVLLDNCHSSSILNNRVTACVYGFYFYKSTRNCVVNNSFAENHLNSLYIVSSSHNNRFEKNRFIDASICDVGMIGCDGNHFVNNDMVNSRVAIFYCRKTVFSQNNFIRCDLAPINSRTTRWRENYYSYWIGFGPKVILGQYWIELSYLIIPVPRLYFDWSPVRTPYEFGGVG